MTQRHTVKVTFDNAATITTEINGTWVEVADYYLGKMFNLGSEADDMHRVISIDFLSVGVV